MEDSKRERPFDGTPIEVGVQIDYEDLDAAWRPGGGEGGRAGGAEIVRLVGRYAKGQLAEPTSFDEPMMLLGVEVWLGLRGGINDEAIRKIRGGQITFDEARVEGEAQVQEITALPYLFQSRRGSFDPGTARDRSSWDDLSKHLRRRRVPGFKDLHQLQPSMSFEADKTTMYPLPWYVPAGTMLGAMARTSQKREGSDVRVTFYLQPVAAARPDLVL